MYKQIVVCCELGDGVLEGCVLFTCTTHPYTHLFHGTLGGVCGVWQSSLL